jgi:RimJ/RimL family protein N-acetyltransferase
MYETLASVGELYIIEVQTSSGWQAIGDAALCPDALPIVIGDSAYRSRGFGGRVLRLLIARARALGWPKLTVKGVFTYNDRARRLYERAGFRIVGVDHLDQSSWRLELLLARSDLAEAMSEATEERCR